MKMLKMFGDYCIEKIKECDNCFSILIIFVIFLLAVAGMVYVKTFMIMKIWNVILVPMFKLPAITMIKAFWINVLYSCLFKNNCK